MSFGITPVTGALPGSQSASASTTPAPSQLQGAEKAAAAMTFHTRLRRKKEEDMRDPVIDDTLLKERDHLEPVTETAAAAKTHPK